MKEAAQELNSHKSMTKLSLKPERERQEEKGGVGPQIDVFLRMK